MRLHEPTTITARDTGKHKKRLGLGGGVIYLGLMTIGQRIRFYRKAANKTQAWLGEKIGVNQNTVSQWEADIREPSREDVARISQTLSVDISALELGDDVTEAHKIRLMGYVGAGHAIESLAGGVPFELRDAPPGAPDGAEAAIVRGGSMYPLLRDGFMLVWWRWTPDPSPHIGELCICKKRDGGHLVKIIEAGSKRGLWTLQSLAPGYEPLRDVSLEAVAPIEIIYRQEMRL